MTTTYTPRDRAFARVVRGLASQKFAQSMAMGSCLYRGPHGCKCAIGWLIPDSKYENRMEDPETSFGQYRYLAKIVPAIKTLTPGMFYQLQRAHDDSRTPKAMRAALLDVAEHYHIRMSAATRALLTTEKGNHR